MRSYAFDRYADVLWTAAVAVFCVLAVIPPNAYSAAEMYRRGYIELEPVYVIGGEDADEDHTLYLVLGFDVDSKGNVFVADIKLNCVKKFDSTGSYLLTFGQEGEGPGDFRAPATLAIGRNDEVIVYDDGNRRIQQLDQQGEYINSLYLTDGFGGEITVSPTGGLYVGVQEIQTGPPTSPQKRKLVRLDDSLVVIGTIDEMLVQTMVVVGEGDGYTGTSAPYPPSLDWAVLPDGRLIVGHSDTDRLRILSPSGDLIRAVVLDRDPPPVTDTDKEKFFASGYEALKDVREQLKDAIEFPAHMPYYSDIAVDAEGNFLLRWSVPVDGNVAYDAYDGDGKYIARFTMNTYPEDIRFRDGFIYARHGAFPEELSTIRCYRMK